VRLHANEHIARGKLGAMGLPRPPGYSPPPPPSPGDVARTVFAVAADVVPYLARMATRPPASLPSTNTVEGLGQIARSFSGTLARLGIALEVLHAERVPRDGSVVFMWNQESHLDHLVLASAIPRPFFSLYNNAVARFPFYGRLMRASGHVHVDRGDESQWRPAITRAAERVKAGECVLVSPEGTRSWDGRLLPMKRGAMMLAARAERPVVCVTVIGGHACLPRGSAVVRPGTIRVAFAELLEGDRDEEALASRIAETFERTKAAHAAP
jgi:1-acyl-sn-glycerol-3-phosphate acyltransferase